MANYSKTKIVKTEKQPNSDLYLCQKPIECKLNVSAVRCSDKKSDSSMPMEDLTTISVFTLY